MSDSKAEVSVSRGWSGRSAWAALGVFLLGRLLLEPLRDAPHFDDRGMEAFSATETYLLRKDPSPVEIAFFGSSQSVWAILPDEFAQVWGVEAAHVRNLASEGGTPFDIWNLLRRNPERLKTLRVAVVEVNPFVLKQGLDSDPRVTGDIAQHATLEERLMLARRSDRVRQVAEWVLPVLSVRRSLKSAFLDVVDPVPGTAVYPNPDQRTFPAVGWKVDGSRHPLKDRQIVPPEVAARRMLGSTRLSRLQDSSLRQSLAWFEAHHVKVILHELPVHPDVFQVVKTTPAFQKGHDDFMAYLDSLRPVPAARIHLSDPMECGMTVEHMADRTHVNELGARLYSRHLANRISGLAGIPLH